MAHPKSKRPTVLGLFKEEALVSAVAKEVGARAKIVTPKQYAGGEWTVWSPKSVAPRVYVVGNGWEDPVYFFQLMQLCDAVRSAGAKRVTWIAPWIAYGRQERSNHPGEPAPGQLVAKMARAAKIDKIVTFDAHSPRFIRAFGGRLKNVQLHDEILAFAKKKKVTAVAAPDEGARNRIKPIAKLLRLPMIQIKKERSRSGRVRSRISSGEPCMHRILLVDDIADSGGTLFAASDLFHKEGADSISAFVTHAKDLARLRKDGKKHHITSIETGFDHARYRLYAPLRLLISS